MPIYQIAWQYAQILQYILWELHHNPKNKESRCSERSLEQLRDTYPDYPHPRRRKRHHEEQHRPLDERLLRHSAPIPHFCPPNIRALPPQCPTHSRKVVISLLPQREDSFTLKKDIANWTCLQQKLQLDVPNPTKSL